MRPLRGTWKVPQGQMGGGNAGRVVYFSMVVQGAAP